MENVFKSIQKTFLLVVGTASLIVGIAGVMLPFLPGLPFLILSKICFGVAATL